MTIPANQIEREERFNRLLASYLEAAETGKPLDRTTWLDEHPDLAGELDNFIQAYERVDSFVAPYRRDVALPPRNQAPSQFGDYEILGELGRGGMGIVYRARQTSLDRPVALKVIRPGSQSSPEDAQRFRNEAEAAAQLDHPGIVPVYEVGDHDGQMFFSMKLIEGGTLARQCGCTPRQAATIVAQVARAVHHAHQRGVLHRDLKPSNILLDADGCPYVADFGLAKRIHLDQGLTVTGALVGTPAFMAPEQAAPSQSPAAVRGVDRAPQATIAVDVYGLGAILYALLTGQPPFRGTTPLDTLAQVMARDPVPPATRNTQVDRDLDAICLMCLEKDPARRYGSAEALAADLERWLAGEPTRARPLGRFGRARRWCRRNPTLAAMTAALAIILLAGVASLGFGLVAVDKARRLTNQRENDVAERAAQFRVREYAADMSRAYLLWRRADLAQLRLVLDRYLPRESEEDLRGFEWYYLRGLLPEHRPPRVRCQGHTDIVYHAAYSRDGKLIASGGAGDYCVRLSDPRTGECLAVLDPPHRDDVNWVDFSPDGKLLLSAGDDHTIRLWDVATRLELAILVNPCRKVECALFSPDGTRIACTGNDGVVRLWSVAEQRIVAEWPTHAPSIDQWVQAGGEMLAYSSDGRLLASAGHDRRVVLRNPETGTVVCETDPWVSALAIAFSPDNSRFAVGNRAGMVWCWKIDGTRIAMVGDHWSAVRGVQFLTDSRGQEWIISCGDDGSIRTWNPDRMEAGDRLASVPSLLWSIHVSPDRRSLVAAGDHGLVHVYDCEQFLEKTRLPIALPDADVVLALRFTPDGRSLALGNRSGRVTLWDLTDQRMRLVLDAHSVEAHRLAFSPSGRWLFSRSPVDHSAVWHLQDRRSPSREPGDLILSNELVAVFHSDNGLVTATDQELADRDWPAYTIRRRLTPEERTTFLYDTVAVSADGDTVAIGRDDSRVVLWNRNDGQVRILDPVRGGGVYRQGSAFRAPSHRLVFSSEGTYLAATLSNRAICVWNLRDGREPVLFESEVPHAIAFAPDGRTIAAGSGDGKIRLLHVASGQDLFTIDRYPGSIVDLAFSPDGQTLATGGHSENPVGPLVFLWHGRRDAK